MMQQMFTQMMQQMGMAIPPAGGAASNPTMPAASVVKPIEPIKLTDDEFEKLVSDAREVFIESAKNLADVIISNVQGKIKAREEELAQKEIVLSQREAAINQQTMANYNQTTQS